MLIVRNVTVMVTLLLGVKLVTEKALLNAQNVMAAEQNGV